MAPCQVSRKFVFDVAAFEHFYGPKMMSSPSVSVENGEVWGQLRLGLKLDFRRPG